MNEHLSPAEAFVPPGFIVGVGRSGTTLLASILNRHRDICVTPETHFFRVMSAWGGGWADWVRRWPGSGRAVLGEVHVSRTWRPDTEEIVGEVERSGISVANLFVKLGESIANSQGKKLWLEKTPAHINDLDIISKVFPEARVIIIVRDGRDVALSMQRVGWGSGSYYENILRWVRENRMARLWLREGGFGMVVWYEKLLSSPAKSIGEICNFLGVSYSDSMLVPNGSEDFLIEEDCDHKESIKKMADVSIAYGWRKTLSTQKRLISELLARDELKCWGYSVSSKDERHWQCDFGLASPIRWRRWPARVDDVVESLVSDFCAKPVLVSSLATGEPNLKSGLIVEGDIVEYEDDMGSARKPILLLKAWWCIRRGLARYSRRKIALVWVYHGKGEKTLRWWYRRCLERLVARHADIIVCSCNEEGCQTASVLKLGSKEVVHSLDDEYKHMISHFMRGKEM